MLHGESCSTINIVRKKKNRCHEPTLRTQRNSNFNHCEINMINTTKRCFAEKLMILDVISKTIDHPGPSRTLSTILVPKAPKASIGTRWEL